MIHQDVLHIFYIRVSIYPPPPHGQADEHHHKDDDHQHHGHPYLYMVVISCLIFQMLGARYLKIKSNVYMKIN